jgi:type VI secretion system secreted protein VgrG
MQRLIELSDTSLFHTDAVATKFEGREALSQPFEYFLTIDSPFPAITPSDVIGKPIGFRLNRADGGSRLFHGYISHLWAGDFTASEGNRALPSRIYRIRIVPWCWFMTRAARSFVYLPEKSEKTILEVLEQVMQHVESYGHFYPWLDTSNASILKNRRTEHCVQYRESDYAFLARTLEKFGVYYYFLHEKTRHTMVLSDKRNYPILEESEIEYPGSFGDSILSGCILDWQHAYEFVSGKWSQIDYDFLHPSSDLRVEAKRSSAVTLSTNSGYELYDYPNDYVLKSDGREESHRRLEEEEVRFNTVSGKSSCMTMTPGFLFRLKSHFNSPSEAGKSYLLTSVKHYAVQPGREVSSEGGEERYSNRFTCIPKEMQYRPPRATPAPHLSGIQTAVVVGSEGEEIYTDAYGRVKVQFHWDREGKRDENTSCWIRVSQSHAGRGFGGIDIPRVGEEVIVSFLEGDPDRPLVTGRVYHKEAMPPFILPDEKTRSGIKTKTYQGSGYNELSMDDTKGAEQIRIHGQHNLDTVVGNDETHRIGVNRTKDIGVDEVMSVGNNQSLKVGVNKTVDVGTDHTETVGANQAIKVGANQTVKVGANQATTVAANQSNTVGSAKTENVGMISNESVGFMKTTNVGAAYSIISGAAMNTAVGFVSAEEVGMTKKVIVGSKLEIIVGASKLVMEAGGKVTIEGVEFLFSASGNVKINGAIIDLN